MVPSDRDSRPPKLKSSLRAGNVPPLAKRVTLPVPQITFASRADEDVMLDPMLGRVGGWVLDFLPPPPVCGVSKMKIFGGNLGHFIKKYIGAKGAEAKIRRFLNTLRRGGGWVHVEWVSFWGVGLTALRPSLKQKPDTHL